MPIYEYRCEDCEIDFEHFASMDDETLPMHDVCHGANVVKRFTGISFNKHQGQKQIKKTDDRGSYTTEHWDGRKDVNVVPMVAKIKNNK